MKFLSWLAPCTQMAPRPHLARLQLARPSHSLAAGSPSTGSPSDTLSPQLACSSPSSGLPLAHSWPIALSWPLVLTWTLALSSASPSQAQAQASAHTWHRQGAGVEGGEVGWGSGWGGGWGMGFGEQLRYRTRMQQAWENRLGAPCRGPRRSQPAGEEV